MSDAGQIADDSGAVVDVAVAGATFGAVQDANTRYGAFWPAFAAGTFEPATIAVLAERLAPGTTFVDVGAWIGPFTLLAAALGARVVAYEPDPVASAQLAANLALNPSLAARVELQHAAVSVHAGTVVLGTGGLGLGNGRSRIVARRRDSEREVTVESISAERLATVAARAGCTMLKIDIEGGEYTVVPKLAPYLRRARPTLLLSLHGPDPMALLSSPFGRIRLLLARLVNAPRRARVIVALRHYDTLQRASDHRTARWTELSRWQRLALVVRAGETELLATSSPALPGTATSGARRSSECRPA